MNVDEENVLNFPVMLLTGHESEIYSIEFSQDGQFLASGGKDRQILLYEAFGECRNFGVLTGHKNAVLEVHWNKNSNFLYSCSADFTASVWDVNYAKRIRKLKGHSGIVNSCYPARNRINGLLVTGSDDGTVKVWDSRDKSYANSISHDFQILSVTTDPDHNFIYSGSLDNIIRIYDVRNDNKVYLELKGCMDSITSLDLNEDNSLLLSNSMDNKLTIWNILPYADNKNGVNNRIVKILYGPKHNSEKNLIKSHWGRNSVICSGSADQFVYIIDTVDEKILYQLPGHIGTVNDAQLHPNIPIIASCSNDKTIYIGQL
ncbi:U5 small nuclear ribonucleoprotein 40 kDa protein [Theileria parva strain Muguga]|uniref:U5 small nuclear ribonucleoprotein 40 kDa protein n=1 Tax=Theileria parva strain Muguga TaxID=333668 RepID=UPI001C61A352|nr:U5 small nuclear ribonucleoprotein 40 kDa protein [Theileria parva strain Muguga]EAN31503.2 U5 small nuclear ribonucleoprotein 40 kDa protein [Theileria parva strain Muguga]